MNKVIIRRSKIRGRGLFAEKDIKKGEVIGIVDGPIVPDNQESYKKYGEDHLHPISYTQDILNSNFTKYTNHSCDPNCGLENGIKIISIRDIVEGEEITIDYDTLEYNWEMVCNCGSYNCRRKIRGYKYLSKELKLKYKGFISPYLLNPPKTKRNKEFEYEKR